MVLWVYSILAAFAAFGVIYLVDKYSDTKYFTIAFVLAGFMLFVAVFRVLLMQGQCK